jgi:hypothetical protein
MNESMRVTAMVMVFALMFVVGCKPSVGDEDPFANKEPIKYTGLYLAEEGNSSNILAFRFTETTVSNNSSDISVEEFFYSREAFMIGEIVYTTNNNGDHNEHGTFSESGTLYTRNGGYTFRKE